MENKKEACVVINVFVKCDKDDKYDKCDKCYETKYEAKKENLDTCVEINVFAECEKEK